MISMFALQASAEEWVDREAAQRCAGQKIAAGNTKCECAAEGDFADCIAQSPGFKRAPELEGDSGDAGLLIADENESWAQGSSTVRDEDCEHAGGSTLFEDPNLVIGPSQQPVIDLDAGIGEIVEDAQVAAINNTCVGEECEAVEANEGNAGQTPFESDAGTGECPSWSEDGDVPSSGDQDAGIWFDPSCGSGGANPDGSASEDASEDGDNANFSDAGESAPLFPENTESGSHQGIISDPTVDIPDAEIIYRPSEYYDNDDDYGCAATPGKAAPFVVLLPFVALLGVRRRR